MVSTGPRPRIAVLGDDLTGAADAAAPFAERGLVASVALGERSPTDVDVLALVTDSRWRTDAQASDRVRAAAARLDDWRPGLRFVKVDSTLRGRVREDVSLVLGQWPTGTAVATPAFPAQGRTVRDGALFVHGELAVPRVADKFPPQVRVADAETHEEMLALAREIVDGGATAIGSGGLARALSEVLVDQARSTDSRPAAVTGVLVVAGTPHPVTRDQTSHLVQRGATSVVLGRSAALVETSTTTLRAGGRVVLTCAPDGCVAADSAASVALAEEVARAVRAITLQAPSAGLILTGGATALAVAHVLGATELRLRGEAAQGLPWGELRVGDRRIAVVTKSGGFGKPNALVRAAEALEESA